MNHEFDQFATQYRQEQTKYLSPTGENSHYFAQLKAKKLKTWAAHYKIYNPQNILDFGCGDGLMSYEVKKIFKISQVFGIDPSYQSINIAQKNAPDCIFYASEDVLTLFKNEMFDIIYCAGVFHHIPFDQHDYYIQNLYQILKPGGILVLFELNPLNPGTQYIFNGHPMEKNATMLTPWYAKKITKLFYKETVFYCFFPKFLNFLRPIEKWLSKLPFGGLYGTISQK